MAPALLHGQGPPARRHETDGKATHVKVVVDEIPCGRTRRRRRAGASRVGGQRHEGFRPLEAVLGLHPQVGKPALGLNQQPQLVVQRLVLFFQRRDARPEGFAARVMARIH